MVNKIEKPTNIICEGCEKPIDHDNEDIVIYFCDYWHIDCAREDRRFHQAWDAEERYRTEFDE